MNSCIFCEYKTNISPKRLIYEYAHWRLAVQIPEKLDLTKQSAGLLISKRHFVEYVEATRQEVVELKNIIKDAAERLCVATGTTYTNQETVGFNQGHDAGQTQFHCHIHILPVAKEDPPELKIRSGIGGAFEALRKERLGESCDCSN